MKLNKYTVQVTKEDGASGKYHVVALTAGGAEKTVLSNVYGAKYALATEEWPGGVRTFDLVSQAAATIAVNSLI